MKKLITFGFFFSSRRRHTRWTGDWSSDVCSSDLIAGRADIALVSIPLDTDLTELVQALMREIGGGAERALGRAQHGLDAVLRAEQDGADLDKLCASVSQALGSTVEFRPLTQGDGGSSVNEMASYGASAARGWGGGEANGGDADEVSAPIVVGETPIGFLVAPHVLGDAGVGARLVLHAAAFAA